MKQVALMYHDVVAPRCWDASGFPGAAAARYKLETDVFARHLDALLGSGLRFDTVTGTPRGGAGCLLTFDDGGSSIVAIAAALAERGMRGHFFITTSRVGTPGFASAQEIRALRDAGHVVGSHSHTHPAAMSRLPPRVLADEWARSVDVLADLLGERVEVASVPGGFHSGAVARAAAAAGIRYLFTSEPGVRTSEIAGCRVLGRYTLWRGMEAPTALALARGSGMVRLRQWATWNLKKPLKRWAGPVYRLVRGRLLADRAA